MTKTLAHGTHMVVLSESFLMSTNMTGFRWFSKIFAILCLASALEGLNCVIIKPTAHGSFNSIHVLSLKRENTVGSPVEWQIHAKHPSTATKAADAITL